jgi:hypothetical protein
MMRGAQPANQHQANATVWRSGLLIFDSVFRTFYLCQMPICHTDSCNEVQASSMTLEAIWWADGNRTEQASQTTRRLR